MLYSGSNAPESANLTKEDHQVFEAARTAAQSLTKTFELWIPIARAVELARVKADRIGTRPAFQRILEQQGLAPYLGNTWNAQKSTANKLLTILERLPEIEAWRTTLSATQRINWSAPTTIFKHCPIFVTDRPEREDAAALAKVDKFKHEPSGINWNPEDEATLRQSLTEAHAENQRLTAELAEAKTRMGATAMIDSADPDAPAAVESDPYLTALQSEVATLKARIAELEAELAERFAKPLPAPDDDHTLSCGFCGKNQAHVEQLIQASQELGAVCICDECVDLSVGIVAENKAKKSAQESAATVVWIELGTGDLGHKNYSATIGEAVYVLEPIVKRRRFAGYAVIKDGLKCGTEPTLEGAKAFALECIAVAKPARTRSARQKV